jgi:hypothetical protein
VNSYNIETECFRFENGVDVVHLDFGLPDIFYITGLPINGMLASGMIYENNVQVVETHLALERIVGDDFFKVGGKNILKGEVDLKNC